MGVVIGICVKHPGDPTRKTGTDIYTPRYMYIYIILYTVIVILPAGVRAKEPKMAEFWGSLKYNQRRPQRFYGRWGLTKTQPRGFFLILSISFMTDLVPEPNPSQQGVRERGSTVRARVNNIVWLAVCARAAYRPQGNARYLRWGSRRFFYHLVLFCLCPVTPAPPPNTAL
jgi:hypothetical protein